MIQLLSTRWVCRARFLSNFVKRQEEVAKFGFDLHPLNIEKYNENVSKTFQLPPHDGALLVISRPDYFEKCFIPFVKTRKLVDNPVDRSVREVLNEKFPDAKKIYSYDSDVHGNPKIIMQKGENRAILNSFN